MAAVSSPTHRAGSRSLARIIATLSELALSRPELEVYLPFGEGTSSDLLIVDARSGRALRGQAKTARLRNGGLVFNAANVGPGQQARDYHGRADLFLVYAPLNGRCYAVPVRGSPSRLIKLRLEPARNRQVRGVREAEGCELERFDFAQAFREAADPSNERE